MLSGKAIDPVCLFWSRVGTRSDKRSEFEWEVSVSLVNTLKLTEFKRLLQLNVLNIMRSNLPIRSAQYIFCAVFMTRMGILGVCKMMYVIYWNRFLFKLKLRLIAQFGNLVHFVSEKFDMLALHYHNLFWVQTGRMIIEKACSFLIRKGLILDVEFQRRIALFMIKWAFEQEGMCNSTFCILIWGICYCKIMSNMYLKADQNIF